MSSLSRRPQACKFLPVCGYWPLIMVSIEYWFSAIQALGLTIHFLKQKPNHESAVFLFYQVFLLPCLIGSWNANVSILALVQASHRGQVQLLIPAQSDDLKANPCLLMAQLIVFHASNSNPIHMQGPGVLQYSPAVGEKSPLEEADEDPLLHVYSLLPAVNGYFPDPGSLLCLAKSWYAETIHSPFIMNQNSDSHIPICWEVQLISLWSAPRAVSKLPRCKGNDHERPICLKMAEVSELIFTHILVLECRCCCSIYLPGPKVMDITCSATSRLLESWPTSNL